MGEGNTPRVLSYRTDRALLAALLTVAVVGVVDAAIAEEPDLVALFLIIVLLGLVLWARVGTRRRPLRVRADLWAWLQLRSDLSGEPVEAIADRALATYRLQLGEQADPATSRKSEDGPS